jgi:EAL domain-containing protein (putative c-di-GMP-specific phosphodiesterase class I)
VIDDFGTGYSSLYHLYELRFDKLKIDRRFVDALVSSSESAIFVRSIVGPCLGLNLAVTAEGVETEAHAVAAFQHDVHQAQGFLFGRAVPAAEVLHLLSAARRGGWLHEAAIENRHNSTTYSTFERAPDSVREQQGAGLP